LKAGPLALLELSLHLLTSSHFAVLLCALILYHALSGLLEVEDCFSQPFIKALALTFSAASGEKLAQAIASHAGVHFLMVQKVETFSVLLKLAIDASGPFLLPPVEFPTHPGQLFLAEVCSEFFIISLRLDRFQGGQGINFIFSRFLAPFLAQEKVPVTFVISLAGLETAVLGAHQALEAFRTLEILVTIGPTGLAIWQLVC